MSLVCLILNALWVGLLVADMASVGPFETFEQVACPRRTVARVVVSTGNVPPRLGLVEISLMRSVLFTIFVVLHGLVHLLYAGQALRFFELRPGLT